MYMHTARPAGQRTTSSLRKNRKCHFVTIDMCRTAVRMSRGGSEVMLHIYESQDEIPRVSLPPRFSPLGRGNLDDLEGQQPSWGYRVDPNTSPLSKSSWSHANHDLAKGCGLSSPLTKRPNSKEGDPTDNPTSGRGPAHGRHPTPNHGISCRLLIR